MSYVRRDSSGSVTSAGIMHHQSKLDVFIIKAHRLLSNGAAINGDDVSLVNTGSSSSSPQGGAGAAGGAGAGSGAASGASPQQDLTLFQRLSQLYNATISTSLLDDNSTSPKSAIELYQRFQQILKELELSYDVSPYGKYFRRLENGMWQIRDDSELVSDQLWQLVSVSISTVYDAKTGQMLNQTRRRVNSMAASSKNSPSEVIDHTLPQQLQKRLQKLQQDNKHNYYTTPASPSLAVAPNSNGSGNANGGANGMANGIVNGMVNGTTNGIGIGIGTGAGAVNRSSSSGSTPLGKRKYVGIGTPDEDAVEELLQLATKKPRTDLPTIDEDIPQQTLPSRALASKEADLYDRLLREKDDRVKQLEADLESQRQETLWLRKMLLEDLACIRSMLHKKASPGRS
ncbi:Transcription factor [Lachancea thermotolerans]